MKVCEICGNEISTRDGENRCSRCENKSKRNARARRRRREIQEAMESLGLKKVRGSMGGTYYE
jgi:uncharacterized Zn finger protein (UPF0148 family)